MRSRRASKQLAITDHVDSFEIVPPEMDESDRCVECTVLHEPEGEVVADVIFIHGLHGGEKRRIYRVVLIIVTNCII